MSQLRRHSLLESLCSTATGFLLSFAASYLVFPLFGMRASSGEYFGAVAVFTGISIVRQYVWRRVFNWYHHRKEWQS